MSTENAPADSEIPAEFKRAHVIIVDDDATNRLLLREVCEKLEIGIIDEAEDGEAALDLITRFRPDLILLDIRMPRMDGFELMRRLRANPMFDGLSILVQTSLQGEDDRVRCFNFGATDVVSRPFHLSELKARIRAHLRSAIAARVLFDFRNRIQAHLEITHSFLSAILPTPERISEICEKYGIYCSSVYKPHDEIGGDLWTLRPLDKDNLAIVLIDASAHGLAGAINALRVDCLVQEYHEYLMDPGTFLRRLDSAMAKISFGQLFAGAIAITYSRNNGMIRFAGTNMPAPLVRRDGNVTELKTRGLPLGSGMVDVTTEVFSLLPKDDLVIFSDGWLEAIGNSPMEALKRCKAEGIAVAESLTPAAPLADDLTLIVMQRRENHGF